MPSIGPIGQHLHQTILQNLNQNQVGQPQGPADEITATALWLMDGQGPGELVNLSEDLNPGAAYEKMFLGRDFGIRSGIWNKISLAVTANLGLGFSLGTLASAFDDVQAYISEMQGYFDEIPASIQGLIGNAESMLESIAGFVQVVLPKDAILSMDEIFALLGGDRKKNTHESAQGASTPVSQLGQANAGLDSARTGQLKTSAAGGLNKGATASLAKVSALIASAKLDPRRSGYILAEAAKYLADAEALAGFMGSATGSGGPALNAEINSLKQELSNFVGVDNPFASGKM
ncbi:MAG: hypothetical protein KC476_04810 [Cyanobacteria bacterium HKST-UBA06]|nr:hypothetical protein [Cyanobacteria bacterium HKST-UBA06]